jgi:hypothetical protein
MLLRVQAGPHVRRHCPVFVDLELSPDQPVILFQEPGRRPRACQREAIATGCRLWWMLSRLEPGQNMDYRLKTVAHRKPPVSRWRSDEVGSAQWQVSLDGVPVACLAGNGEAVFPGIGPLFAPGNGRDPWIASVWMNAALSGAEHRRTQITNTAKPIVGPVFARGHRQGAWLGAAGERLADEFSTCTLYATPSHLRLIDFDFDIHASVGPLRLSLEPAGGLLRLRLGSGLGREAKLSLANSAGAATLDEVQSHPAGWLHAAANGGLAVFDHPDNLGSPCAWRIGNDGVIAADPFANLARWQSRVMNELPVLAAGEQLTLRYRLCLHEHAIKRVAFQAHYLDFAFPPRIEIVERG